MSASAKTAAKPLPRLDDANRPHWEGALRNEVCLQQCAACGSFRFPARRHCARCGSEESRWTAVSGRGVVWSFCRFHKAYFPGFAGEVPYTVVQVRLEEGVSLFSNLVGVPTEQIRIGMAVVPYFDRVSDEVALVKFQPAP